MKKVVSFALLLTIMFSLCGCSEKQANNTSKIDDTATQTTNNDGFSEKEFISSIQGYWITKLENEYNSYCIFFNFDRNHYTSGTYCGEFGDDGAITNIKELGNNKYEITIHCSEENEYGLISPYDFTIILSSNDKFNQEMIMETENHVTYQLAYAGTTEEAMWEACDELLENKTALNISTFKERINAAIIEYYEDVNIDAQSRGYTVRQLDIIPIEDSPYDQMATFTYGPGGIISGIVYVKNDEVKKAVTTVYAVGMQDDAKPQAVLVLLQPAVAFNEKYSGYENTVQHMEELVREIDDRTAEGRFIRDNLCYKLSINEFGYTYEIEVLD